MTIKKAELHVHLEGTISPELARKIAIRNKISFPEHIINPDGESYAYQDFLDFLKVYDLVADVIKVPQDYYDITFEYLKETAAGGGIYVEMMYSPDHAEQASGIPSLEHLQAIQQAINDAEQQHHIVGRILITAVRHFGQAAAEKVALQSAKDKLPCVVGFGLGGDEFKFPPKLFKRAYDIAASHGLLCTVHAGEFASAEGMREAMEYLPIQRIGHGVRAIENTEVMAQVKDNNITLEICPTSNIALNLFPDLQQHPLKTLMDAGIKTCLNSDDPPFFKTSLANEYTKIQAFHQFTVEEMQQFTRRAIEAAFVEETTKQLLMQNL